MTPVEKQLAPPGGWHKAERARISPLSAEHASWPMKALLWGAGKFSKDRTGSEQVPDVFLLLMNHQHLFWQWLQFASRLMPYGTLDRRDAEIVILRVGWLTRCRYEWGQHVVLAEREGVTYAEIRRVAEGPNAPGWSARQALVLKAADEIHANHILSTETWQSLTEHFDAGKMLELTLLVGAYEMLAGVLNSVGLPLEDEWERNLAAAPIH